MYCIDPHLFETIMLICFGSSWPFAILKTVRSKTVAGKSIIFILLIFIGYLSGVISKLVGPFDHVIWLYIVNGSMVFTEIVLYFRYNSACLDSAVECVKTQLNRSMKKRGRLDEPAV